MQINRFPDGPMPHEKQEERVLMRTASIAYLVGFCFCAIAQGQLIEDDQKTIANHQRRVLDLGDTVKEIKQGNIAARKITIVWQLLKHTSETSSHQLGGAFGNSFFLHENGHKEVVFDSNKQLVQDGINDGSYNYFPAETSPLRHFTYDTQPWIELGHSKKDPHTPDDRIDALGADLFSGLMRALKEGLPEKLISHHDLNEHGQAEGLAAMLDAIQLGQAEELFAYFDADTGQTPDKARQREMVAMMKEKLIPGLKLLFARIPQAKAD